MRCKVERNYHYLYTVYRNKDDRLIAFDVPSAQAINLMDVKPNTFYRILSMFGGKNTVWTILRTLRKGDSMEEKKTILTNRKKLEIRRERIRRALMNTKPGETICLQDWEIEMVLVWIKELERKVQRIEKA